MKFTEFPISGALCLVTGAGHGIGREIAHLLARRGAAVIVSDLDAAAASVVAGEIGGNAIATTLDVSDPDAFLGVVSDAEDALGGIDVVVNNAGIMPVGPLLQEPRGVADATMRVNYWGHYNAFQAVAPRMIRRGRGHFINIVSAAGAIHSPGLASYVASKHAALGFARSAREELAGTGVTLSAVLPSATRTQLVDGIPFAWWERLGIVSPRIVAMNAVGTLHRRPAVVGSPRGTVALLRMQPAIPEPLWLLGRRLTNADRTMQPIDQQARSTYDARISRQVQDLPVVAP